MLYTSDLTPHELKQQRLAQHCFWDEASQVLWIDCRQFFPDLGVVQLPGWDHLMMSLAEIPDYVLTTLQSKRFSLMEKWEFKDKARRNKKNPRCALPYHFMQYYLRTKPSLHGHNPPGFWKFFMDIRGIKNLKQLPFYMLNRLKHRVNNNNFRNNIE